MAAYDNDTSEDIYGVQVRRLRMMKGYPKSEDAELIRVAHKYAPPGDLLRKVVDHVLEEWDRCPMPAELKNEIQARSAAPIDPDNKLSKWRQEFRQEVHNALRRCEMLPDGRPRKEAESYLRYAMKNHPEIVITEKASMNFKPGNPDLFNPTQKCELDLDPLELITSKATDADYARLRRKTIRDALQATRDGHPDPQVRKFWADHLSWAESWHPEEVAELRAEP